MKIIKSLISLFIILSLSLSQVFSYTKFSSTNLTGQIDTEKKGVLSADIDVASTTITLEATPASTLTTGLALLGEEVINITAATPTSLTVTRGATHPHASSTASTATTHAAGKVVRNISQVVDIKFTPAAALVATDNVIVKIPNNTPNTFGAMGTATSTGATVTKNDAERTFTLTALTGAGEKEITITGIEMPENLGQFSIPLEIRSQTGTLIESGTANIAWGNNVMIKAFIQPALIMSLDKNYIDISANPSVNDGEDYSQKSVLTVSTNALNGYKILANLKGKQTAAAAQLDSSTTTSVISSSDAIANENAFSYVAYNGNGADFEQPDSAAGRTAMNNETTRTRDQIKADTNVSTAFANTDTVLLPTKVGATTTAEKTPGNGTTEVAYDDMINISKHTIYYLLNVDFEIPSANYEGIVTYTATPSF